ncbi:MAG: Trk family potassium uptake protein [Anaerolineales bacterium]|nr:Trk family potassium uptake protein [Anaerolineales bacterium]
MITYKQVRQYHLEQINKSTSRGPQIVVLGFALIILIGTVLLTLPIATEDGQGMTWIEALFTATSATTVTGLVVVNTKNTFSLFGELVILTLIQVGGVGFITLSVVLFRLIGRRVSIYERNLLSQTLGVGGNEGIVRLTLTVLFITLTIEFIGALVLFTQWVQLVAWPQAAYYSIFHAVSAFCNAGFDLFDGFEDPLLQTTRVNPISLVNLGLLITIGGLGITAVYDLIAWPRERRLSLHTRLILPMTLLLLVVGTLLLILDETFVNGHALSAFSWGERWLLAAFSVVASRTAGFTLVPLADLGQASQLVILVWMFIGGAPASMGGGVGLTTVAVVLITLASNVRGYQDVRILERTLPTETIHKAVAIITVSTALVTIVTLCLILFREGELFPVAFEVVSAFSNTGYSLGITESFDAWGKIILAFTMFWGRLGPLTLVVALAQRDRKSLIHYPEEKIIIG